VNPIVRHFLPSVVRGVYRFDDAFSEIEDEKTFQHFVDGKLKFLPSNLVADVCRAAKLSDDFRSAQHQRMLPAELLETAQSVAPRTKAFFRLHRYFENALVGDRLAKDDELKDAQNYLEIQFVKRILAPLLNDEGLRAIHPQRNIGPYSRILRWKEAQNWHLNLTASASLRRGMTSTILPSDRTTSRRKGGA
jgi:hypothetical protein